MKKLISIVTPTFNEEKDIYSLSKSISLHMSNSDFDYEHIIIDNASTDNTQEVIRKLCLENKKIKAIFNQRNFGHIRSPYYAILQTKGDAVILLAADGQDPPELIVKLIEKWNNGSDAVFLKRNSSKTNFFLEFIKIFFYKIINLLSEIRLLEKTTGSGIFDKKIIEQLRKIEEPYPYFRGLIMEITNKIDIVEFDQPNRKYGQSKNNFFTFFDIAMLGIIKHSKLPLRLMTITGFIFSILACIIGIFFFIYKLLFWDSFQLGLAPIIIGLFFGISFQILLLGIIGEYVGFTLTQVRKFPLVIEKERINF
ncbi:MAG: glycosyltransferase [Pelagibacteraceae bacterium]|nr:MAG: glycosyltransferase [Pelagibacteraceae bacterium]